MKQENINRVVSAVAAGNPRMRILASGIVEIAADQMEKWPDDCEGMLVRRVVHAAGILIHRRIRPTDLAMGEAYWLTEEGKQTDKALTCYWQRKLERQQVKSEVRSVS